VSDDTPAWTTSVESLRKEAKRWLKAIRAGDSSAAERFRRTYSAAPATPSLRDVQHALALERGFGNWRGLTAGAGRSTFPTREAALAALLEAAGRGNLEQLRTVLDEYPDVINERGLLKGHSGMRTALHHAVGSSEDAVRLLLERGADPNVRDEGDWAFPIHFAAEKGSLPLVKLLVEHGADTNGEGDHHELGVIGWASAWDYVPARPELVDYLLAHGARHTICSAVAMGDVEAIRRIVAASPAELERRMDLTNRRRRPVHLAVVKQQPAALAALLDLGADPDTLDESGLTALDQAALRGEVEMAQALVDRGARMGMAAAVALGRTADVERLIRMDPDGLKPGHRWGTLIVRASERSSGSVVEALIGLGASPNAWDDPHTAVDGAAHYTPLHAAAWNGNVDAIRVLLKHGANPAARETRYCATPAGWANYAGKTDARDLILQGPIDVFEAIDLDLAARIPDILARDPQALERPFGEYVAGEPRSEQWWPEPWMTPLVWAILRGRRDAARTLLVHGADPSRRTPDGRTLGGLVPQERRAELDEWLREAARDRRS
jgi:ankyrin repeat protein